MAKKKKEAITNRVNSMVVLKWIQKRTNKTFTTQDVADEFGITQAQARANIAVLNFKERLLSKIDAPEGSTDKSSHWIYIGQTPTETTSNSA
jgi:response regulator of citrate/malate metabolism